MAQTAALLAEVRRTRRLLQGLVWATLLGVAALAAGLAWWGVS
jgi:hypothetical protein